MEYRLERIELVGINVNFEKVEQYLRDENGGKFVDNFSDNLEQYIKDIYGIDFDETEENEKVCNDIFNDWQNYLESRGLID